MSRRTITSALWFLAGWTFGSMLSFSFGLPGGLDAAFGVAAGGLMWWDPARLVWSRRTRVVARPAEVVSSSTLAPE